MCEEKSPKYFICVTLFIFCLLFHTETTTVKRYRRDFDLVEFPEPCDFGSIIKLTMCIWNVPENITNGKIKWRPGMGSSSYWIGGPRTDHTEGDKESGYVFYETSELASVKNSSNFESQLLSSPVYNHTGPMGLCLTFFYSIAGLSAKSLRVLLRNSLDKDTVLWESKDNNDGIWHLGEVAYSYSDKHRILFEAVPNNQSMKKLSYRYDILLNYLFYSLIILTTGIYRQGNLSPLPL